MTCRIGVALACGAALLASTAAAAEAVVVDAGRVRVDGHLIRLHGVDAPRDGIFRCSAERFAAKQARARLEQLIRNAAYVSFRRYGMACPSFIACDGFVSADGVDVGEQLLAEGLVKPTVVDPDAPATDWCGR